ncbi:MAG: hypothetical protein R2856_17135 [Caldilineaceae bacterium]
MVRQAGIGTGTGDWGLGTGDWGLEEAGEYNWGHGEKLKLGILKTGEAILGTIFHMRLLGDGLGTVTWGFLLGTGLDWGLGTGDWDWGLGTGDWGLERIVSGIPAYMQLAHLHTCIPENFL